MIPNCIYSDEASYIPMEVIAHVKSITALDTSKQMFTARLIIILRWQMNFACDCNWRPELEFENAMEEFKINDQLFTPNHEDGKSQLEIQCQNTFSEYMELHYFPLDQQCLHIKIMFKNCRYGLRSIKFLKRSAFIYEDGFIQLDDFRLFKQIKLMQGFTMPNRYNDKYTTLTLLMYAQRLNGFYVWNIVIPIFLLVSLSFVSFILDIEDFNMRFNITLTLLLTLVATKFSISTMLPQTSYLTLLDKYILTSFSYITIVALQNTVTFYLNKKEFDFVEELNMYSGITLVAIWFMFHKYILLQCYRWNYKKKIYKSDDSTSYVDEIEVRKLSSIDVVESTLEQL